MAKKRTVYRDTKTGKFTSKKTWRRSRSRGGDRYKRERITVRKPKKPGPRPIPPPTPPPEPEVFEYIVAFSYDKSGRSFDVIVTARSEQEARDNARLFLKSDAKGKNIARAKFAGWSQSVARGRASAEEAGEAEYRQDSEEE